jgi:two-component system sensor histidine kinase ChvG
LRQLTGFYDWFFYLFTKARDETPVYYEKPYESAADYPEVQRALLGYNKGYVRRTQDGYLVLSHAVPVQRYKTVFGALMLSMSSAEIDENVRSVRQDIVQVFGVVLVFTVLMSLYLARTIAAPINKLAATAEAMRRGKPRSIEIPMFQDRRDEIGDLSAVLHDLTNDLWDRMDAIEGFAADVAHEIKNPLSSLRSAVETAAKVKDPEQQRKLMAVIEQDVRRLDRLITDISRASRIDAEMSRVSPEPIDLRKLLETFVDIHETTREAAGTARLELRLAPRGSLTVKGHEDRLVQVLRNLVTNAESFSPPDGTIVISAAPSKDQVLLMVEDQGPGIPDSKLQDIFKRFYTERPTGEAFGQHSGLGLSISKQIIEALGGTIQAENVHGPDGKVRGARFLITLQRA